jgi:hypothetical protein
MTEAIFSLVKNQQLSKLSLFGVFCHLVAQLAFFVIIWRFCQAEALVAPLYVNTEFDAERKIVFPRVFG